MKKAEEQATEKKNFVGKWQAVTCFKDGKPFREGVGKVITITPEAIIVDGAKWPYRVNRRADPKEIDISEGVYTWNVFGIYHFKNDKLTLFLSRHMTPRPTSFDLEDGVWEGGKWSELTVYKKVME
jgi:uncharacterized protein (TIGR03067 family)